jgi:endonuclease/exonuclease/phosphatase family metal-dependent hydrolase
MGNPDQLRVLHWNIHSWRGTDDTSNLPAVTDVIRQTAPHVVSLTGPVGRADGPVLG